MSMQIAGSYEEVLALLRRLRGQYVHSNSDRFGTIAAAAFVLALFGVDAFGRFEDGFDVAFAIVMLLFAAWVIVERFATFEISEEGVEKRLPIRGRVWRVAAGEIRSIELRQRRGWYLRILAAERARVVTLTDSLRDALGELHPEVARPKALRQVYGYIAYAALAAAMVMFWILLRNA